jgi:hypothetical protein
MAQQIASDDNRRLEFDLRKVSSECIFACDVSHKRKQLQLHLASHTGAHTNDAMVRDVASFDLACLRKHRHTP